MDRKFGVELELVEITREQAVRALTGVGIAVREEGYNHETRRHWKIVSDSSVRGGFEVVSPVLQGEAGLDEVRKATTALDDMGATANRSCGYHVHLDAEGLTASDIRAIVTRYADHESEIDAFMPPSRRGNSNTYCSSVVQLARSERFQNAGTIRDLVNAQGGRYFKVNLQSYYVHKTIEFRQHSGTINAAKAGYRGASRMRKPSKVLLQGLQRHRAFGEHRGKPSLHPAAYRDFRAGWPSAGFDKLL